MHGTCGRTQIKLTFAVVVPKGHEWASLGSIPAAHLMGVPLLMRERGSGSRHVIEEGLQRAGPRLGQLTIVRDSRLCLLRWRCAGVPWFENRARARRYS
jgi:DNA-binding transcriptional LysR family regulator